MIIEYRAVNEVRTVDDEKSMIIEGVVNNIGQWSKPIGGQFREKINEGVFERAINRALENGDIFKMRAVLPDTSFSRDIYELVKSGVLREFSFGFNKPKSKWKIGKDGIKERSLVDFDIHEISIVRVGAYNETQAYARAFDEIKDDSIYKFNMNKIKLLI
ncbi:MULTISPECIES: HK97 family phage prohead protease [Clostridium]|uniref:HK97 family phage prohead protease n=1 Tax=Clostridium TaxID=1485 RepID=UPI00290294E2|nr:MULTISPECIES: HK97 family phage prohead protease [Clostridium]MDU1229889.1 HK97 family phage prohead protease [Clostridium sp.]